MKREKALSISFKKVENSRERDIHFALLWCCRELKNRLQSGSRFVLSMNFQRDFRFSVGWAEIESSKPHQSRLLLVPALFYGAIVKKHFVLQNRSSSHEAAAAGSE